MLAKGDLVHANILFNQTWAISSSCRHIIYNASRLLFYIISSGLRITSTEDISVQVSETELFSTDGYELLPTSQLHHTYRIMSYMYHGPESNIGQVGYIHDDVSKWKHVSRYWPFVRRIHRSTVNSLHKGQWRGAFMFLIVWPAPVQTVEQTIEMPVIWDVIELIMKSLLCHGHMSAMDQTPASGKGSVGMVVRYSGQMATSKARIWNCLSIPKLQRLHRWSLGTDNQFNPPLYNGRDYLSMLGLKLNHVSKRGPGRLRHISEAIKYLRAYCLKQATEWYISNHVFSKNWI